MGVVTPNIGIFIPNAGSTNYDSSFAAGMANVDLHDHSGGPNKGVPITSSGIDAGAITYDKLNPNVVDTTSGLGTHTGGLANQITTTGLLKSIASLVSGTGFIAQNAFNANALTITGTANQIAVASGNGASGNPVISIATPMLLPSNPAFQAYNSVPLTNVTGDGTLFNVTMNSHTTDRANNYSSPNFTAPSTGVYFMTCSLVITGLTSSHTSMQFYLQSSGSRTDIQWGFRGNPYACSDSGVFAVDATGVFALTAGDIVTPYLTVSNGSKVVNVYGAALSTGPTSFEGFLVS
jgi:hypothetical protein